MVIVLAPVPAAVSFALELTTVNVLALVSRVIVPPALQTVSEAPSISAVNSALFLMYAMVI